ESVRRRTDRSAADGRRAARQHRRARRQRRARAALRPLHHRGPAGPRRVEAGLAHHADQHLRRAAGHRRPRDGGPLRGLQRQRRHRGGHADLDRHRGLHHVGVHGDERAGGALRGRGRRGNGRPHRLPGVPDRARHLAAGAGPGGLAGRAVAADPGERHRRRAGRGAALPADIDGVQQRHADLLPHQRRAALGRRRAHAHGAGHRHDAVEHRAERGVHHRRGPHPRVRNGRRGDGNGDRGGAAGCVLAVQAVARRMGGLVSQGPGVRTRLGDHQVALPLRAAGGDPGDRHERGRAAAAGVHRLAGAERGGPGRVRGVVRAALFAGHLDVGGADGRRRRGRRAEPGRRPAGPRQRGGARGGAHRHGGRGLPGPVLLLSAPHAAGRVRHGRAGGGGHRRAAAAHPERFGADDRRGAHLHRRPAGHGRHQGAAVHLHRLAGDGAAGHLRRGGARGHAGPAGHLARHPGRAHHPLRPQRPALPEGRVAEHRGRRAAI
ncbi:MAG: hypothetical protein AVDCRST_MAG89-616, partial [uncultured Gemmatimonadetes bacterium]